MVPSNPAGWRRYQCSEFSFLSRLLSIASRAHPNILYVLLCLCMFKLFKRANQIVAFRFLPIRTPQQSLFKLPHDKHSSCANKRLDKTVAMLIWGTGHDLGLLLEQTEALYKFFIILVTQGCKPKLRQLFQPEESFRQVFGHLI